jgi:DNA repair protein RecO
MTEGGFAVTDAIVLAQREVADDCVRLDCYTERFGRVTGYLRKARWEKIFAAASGSIGELTIRNPLGQSAPLVANYERKALFYGEGMNSSAFWGILTIIEALYRLLPYREADPNLYRQAVDSLVVLGGEGRPAPTVISFLLHLLDSAGYRWRLERCQSCGIESAEDFLLVPEEGAIRCRRCRTGPGYGVVLSMPAVAALRSLAGLSPEEAAAVTLHREVAADALRAIALGLPCHFDRRLESLAVLESPRSAGRTVDRKGRSA